MDFISEDIIQAAESGDIDTLLELDQKGLLLGPDETLKDYARRLQSLNSNIIRFREELKEKGYIDILEMQLENTSCISSEVFQEAENITKSMYDFHIDWVPGFFTDAKMGMLFAGCAMYSYEDFFAIFIVRKAFQNNKKWLIYSRQELISHELCHIAHIAFNTREYEELFAYQTSESAFRRIFGGVLQSQKDSYILFSVMVLSLFAQAGNVLFRPPMEWQSFPIPLVYAMVFLTTLFFGIRYFFFWNRFRKAKNNISRFLGRNAVLPILFRCSSNEIKEISSLNNREYLYTWMEEKSGISHRWKMIKRKYLTSNGQKDE